MSRSSTRSPSKASPSLAQSVLRKAGRYLDGKISSQFEVKVKIRRVTFSTTNKIRILSLEMRRGSRVAKTPLHTTVISSDCVGAEWEAELSLDVTLFRAQENAAFESKLYSLELRQHFPSGADLTPPPSNHAYVKVATFDVDLAEYTAKCLANGKRGIEPITDVSLTAALTTDPEATVTLLLEIHSRENTATPTTSQQGSSYHSGGNSSAGGSINGSPRGSFESFSPRRSSNGGVNGVNDEVEAKAALDASILQRMLAAEVLNDSREEKDDGSPDLRKQHSRGDSSGQWGVGYDSSSSSQNVRTKSETWKPPTQSQSRRKSNGATPEDIRWMQNMLIRADKENTIMERKLASTEMQLNQAVEDNNLLQMDLDHAANAVNEARRAALKWKRRALQQQGSPSLGSSQWSSRHLLAGEPDLQAELEEAASLLEATAERVGALEITLTRWEHKMPPDAFHEIKASLRCLLSDTGQNGTN